MKRASLRRSGGRMAVFCLALVLGGCVSVSVAAPSRAPASAGPAARSVLSPAAAATPPRTASAYPPSPASAHPPSPGSARTAATASARTAGPASLTGPGATAGAVPSPAAADPLAIGSARPDGAVPGITAERKLQRILRRAVGKGNVAGLSVAVRLPDGRTWTGVAGNAEFGPVRKIEPDTVFAIASVSKTFVAALILQLAEEGRLGLDEPFGTYFADAPRSRTVTIRQLLAHRSGIYDYFANRRYIDASTAWLREGPAVGLGDRDRAWSYEDIMSLVKPGYCPPGDCYHYSNTNYVILGRVAEVAGGAPLHIQLRERFFDPLGLEHTIYQPDEPTPLDAAHGHWASGSGHIDHTRDSRVIPFMAALTAADAAGAIASTPGDLATWADALFGGRVLSRASLRAMTDFLPPDLYGLGARWGSFAGHQAVGHRGGLRGYEASLWYFPAEDVSIALLSNQGNWDTDAVLEPIARAVLGRR